MIKEIGTYFKFSASFQDSLLDGFDLVAGQVEKPQAGEPLELDGREYRIQRVAEQIISQSKLN
jgi:hypothetical protein